jgi:tetratricopeptide (TPR) repeat protein
MSKRLIIVAILILVAPALLRGQDNAKIDLANEYLGQGDVDKALDLYKDLVKDSRNIPFVHNNYLALLINLENYKEAEDYVEKQIKRDDGNLIYKIDLGMVYQAAGKADKANSQFESVIAGIKGDNYKLRITAQTFISKQLREYALKAYLAGRQSSGNQYAYAIELANIYRLLNNREQMMEEYLNFAIQNPNNINYVRNILQNLLTEPEDLEALETILIQKVQKSPNDIIYGELLIWAELQQKNFFGAFTQARAIDRRERGEGSRVLEIGIIAIDNGAFEDAEDIFSWIIQTYPSSSNYVLARRMLIKAREGKVKNTYPVDTTAIRTLIADYDNLIKDSGLNSNTLEALRSKALLYAFYLDEKDQAISTLKDIINFPRAQPQLVSSCKLDLGDIYLLIGEPWESTLLYSQVEKDSKESLIGYEAKLKNAKLNYYNGDFELAKAHLDILKLATSREISNDAMALSLLIQDNTLMDTTELAMKKFAAVDLLLFQNKKIEALQGFDSLLNQFPNHRITDEVWYKMAQINQELGHPEVAIALLDNVLASYPTDILGDDALFLKGKIIDKQLGNKQLAMEAFQALLTTYPGSIYTAEARKRFRELRGDLNQ